MEDLSIGTVVYLNSGSPSLTVTKVTSGEVVVTWMDPHSEGFNSATLPIKCVSLTDPRA